MAANFKVGAVAVSSFGKRIAGRFFAGKISGDPNPVTSTLFVLQICRSEPSVPIGCKYTEMFGYIRHYVQLGQIRTVVAHYSSTYDKNVEEQIRPAFIPDHVMGFDKVQEDKYWAPHPKTGVFGPTTGAYADVAETRGTVVPKGNGGSVMDQTAWFRPLEDVDVEKPHN